MNITESLLMPVIAARTAALITTGYQTLGISLALRSAADRLIQSNPIASQQPSRDTSHHFQHDSQQPEKRQ